jgi:fructokinase
VSAFHPKPGGAPANVAVAASRLGYRSAFLGKVGEDAFGHFLADVMSMEGVETCGLRFDPQVRTTLVFISKPDVNSYDCLFYRNPGADTCLRVEELEAGLLGQAGAFQFGSLSLTDEPSRSATLAAIEMAHRAGALVCYDVNYRPSLWGGIDQARLAALEVIPRVDMVKVNDAELAMLAGDTPMQAAARKLREYGPQICVVTLGEKGSYIQTSTGDALIPAFPVKAVDAAGCGDAFLAALLCRMPRLPSWRSGLDPAELAELLRFANAVGALAATHLGTIPSFPSAEQVQEFLKENA